jgi:hypothetical protein
MNARYFHWLGVTSVRCPDCGADLMPGVDLTPEAEHQRQMQREYEERCSRQFEEYVCSLKTDVPPPPEKPHGQT